MKNHIDITFDLETVATTANAAVMQVAAVVWMRDAESDPFKIERDDESVKNFIVFNEHIDLRSCVVDGFDFDPDTVQWWSQQSEKAKKAVTAGLAKEIKEVFTRFIDWVKVVTESTEAKSVCLWCQGMDFDGAILRNVCRKYDLKLPLRYQQFRDSRTVILEAAAIQAARNNASNDAPIPTDADILADDRKAYALFPSMPFFTSYSYESEAHDALYDAMRSSWNAWQALKMIKGITN